jgi:hypothetical protein
MTAYSDRLTLARPTPARRHPILATLGGWLGSRHGRRLRLHELDARLLYDFGIEPQDVANALNDKRRSVWFHPAPRRMKSR